jgi:hypothetical protein
MQYESELKIRQSQFKAFKNNKMKNLLTNIVFIIVVIGLPYLFFAYLNYTINPLKFGLLSRFVFGLWVMLVMVFSVRNWNSK